MANENKCTRCGRCCIELSVRATSTDIMRWHYEWEDDILEWCSEIGVDMIDFNVPPNSNIDEPTRCHFLRKVRGKPIYKCTIHHTKPDMCRLYDPETCIAKERKETA